MESKPQLVGIHERVRSDLGGSQPPTSTGSSAEPGGKRVVTAANPNAEDAADLLRYVTLSAVHACRYTRHFVMVEFLVSLQYLLGTRV